MKKEKIVVTGGAGFIGSNLVDKLLELGFDVHIIDNFSDYYPREIKEKNIEEALKNGAVLHELDLVKDNLDRVLKDVEYVIHCAAQPGISKDVSFDKYKDNNLIATHNLLESVLKNIPNIKLFVNFATSSVYGLQATGDESVEVKPASYYGVTKLAAEQLALYYSRMNLLPVVSLRPFSIYGERERPEKIFPKLVNSAFSGEKFTLFEGSDEHIRSYTYVGDLVNGIISSMEKPEVCVGNIINIGSDETHKTSECIKLVEKLTGKNINIEIVDKRIGDQKETKANIEKASKMLSFKPKVNLEEGLKRYIEWTKRNS